MISLDLPAYLSGKGVRVYKAAGAEVTAHCWWCSDGDPKGKGRLYINTESGLWSCKRCDTHGNRKTMLRHFGDEDKAEFEFTPGTNPALRRKALSNAADLATEMLYNNPKILEYLGDRGLWPATVVAAQLGYVPASWSLVRELRADNTYADLRQAGLSTATGGDFFSGHVLIPYISHGDVVQLRGKSMAPGGKYVTPADDNARLYNASSLLGARDAFIIEGEFDTLIVQQYLRTSTDPNLRDLAVVGLPGANALPTSFASYFETCRRVYIGLDPDPVGEKAALRIKELLGTKGRIVHLPAGVPKVDWTDYLRPKSDDYPNAGHGLADIERLIFEADAEGRRLFTVREAFQKWHKIETEVGGIQLGFRDLDTWIAPGLKPGQLCIPLAKTGCIQGDAMIGINRAGKGSQYQLSTLVRMFNGGKNWGKSWREDIPTYVQREMPDGTVRLGRLLKAWCSGEKTTYTVTTDAGRQVRATDEHPFLTERGWLRLDQLVVGDEVHVRGPQASGKSRNAKASYHQTYQMDGHPFHGAVRPDGTTTVPTHRLIAEARMNGLDLGTFVAKIQSGEPLTFLDPVIWAVHHKDHDHRNNEPGNLEVLTHPAHARRHADEGNAASVLFKIATERVVSVVLFGMEETYDLEVADEPHNFLANGFVVHNTGKTMWLINVAWNLRARPTLLCSLEMSAAECYLRLQRVANFWYPLATDADIAMMLKNLLIYDRGMTSGDLTRLLDDFNDEMGVPPQVVMLDYLGYYANRMKGGSPYERTSQAAIGLKEEAKAGEVVLISPHQVGRGTAEGAPIELGAARDSGAVEETADVLLSLYKPADADRSNNAIDGTVRMEVLKNRNGRKNCTTSLNFSLASLVLVDKSSMASRTVEDENMLIARGDTYATVRRFRRHQAGLGQQVLA